MVGIGKVIKKYREEHDLSLRDFAKQCGLSHAYIDKLESGIDPVTGKPVSPTVATITAIAKAMGMNHEILMRLAGYITTNDPRPSRSSKLPPDIRRIARAGEKMTPEQRERLLKVAEVLFPEAFKEE